MNTDTRQRALDPQVLHDLVAANRILANEGVVDAYGHVSIRHPRNPDRYLIARSISPALVTAGDIMEYGLDGKPVDAASPTPYLERHIHGAIYEKRPDVQAVVHSHAVPVLPFTLTDVPLQAVIHVASDMGAVIPRWDIRDSFGDTNLLVVDMDQGRDLAETLGSNKVVLMRGHGFTATGRSLIEVVKISVYLPVNAQVQLEASRLGPMRPLSPGEIEIRSQVAPDAPQMRRAWDYWCRRAGISPEVSAGD
ncbi:class II aldolase/adducin family protein [Verticiella sediminum]|uniref:Class II aldolase/adducin family protein n=1 Tax=Verticiella sediminum TaxID=1247510 RepID=A0A556ABW7_9BURK|nr:class II aldolase/adducin family protein [Verticiella sediminum]TSH90382.1 class II aldolase/adducin family protein [Verticiella sediminum]